ncbi:MAG: LytTR family DNA-binding domain-containing protein [Cytophagaceae bacterium]|jgi:DNA-binding LytR/AlgR family response regulator|nr:LytTR family DNA-binding domain-containing protein [Cytophagaceae bacterium]
MNCIVVDDDRFSAKIIEDFVQRTNRLRLSGSFSSAIDAVNMLNSRDSETVDLIFLDIEMPEMSGIDFLKSLNDVPQVIICSSEEKYALESYEYDVTDYLLKPVQYGRFIKALGKVRERIEKKQNSQKQQNNEIFIRNNSSLIRLKYDDILWFEALENYVVINTFNEKYTLHLTMKSIEDKMPSNYFVKVHRSFLVNLSKIKIIEGGNLIVATKTGDTSISIAKGYRNNLLNHINLLTK